MQKDLDGHPATDRASGESWTPEKAAQRSRAGARRDGATRDWESQMAAVQMPPNVETHGKVTFALKAPSVGGIPGNSMQP